jgi:hypothetical protein
LARIDARGEAAGDEHGEHRAEPARRHQQAGDDVLLHLAPDVGEHRARLALQGGVALPHHRRPHLSSVVDLGVVGGVAGVERVLHRARRQRHAAHHPKLQHHFYSMEQQLEASTLGMWVFLVTEIMFFGGLFCAYLIYRLMHFNAFAAASQQLSIGLGAFNTAVLLVSSVTVVLAVKAAQEGKAGRQFQEGNARRSRDRHRPQHAQGRRADHPPGLRARAGPRPYEGGDGGQVERPDPRPRALAAGVQAGGGGVRGDRGQPPVRRRDGRSELSASIAGAKATRFDR